MKWWAYIVRCVDGTFYTGYARDPIKRAGAHNAGRGAKYTAGRRPVVLVYTEGCRTRNRAMAREWALKQMPRADKESLIAVWLSAISTPAPEDSPDGRR